MGPLDRSRSVDIRFVAEVCRFNATTVDIYGLEKHPLFSFWGGPSCGDAVISMVILSVISSCGSGTTGIFMNVHTTNNSRYYGWYSGTLQKTLESE